MQEFWMGLGWIVIYFVICASTAFLCRVLFRIPTEIFRKTLHLILLGSLPVFVFGFDTWWIAATAAILFEIVVFPILKFFERFRNYSSFVTERKNGELKSSLLLVFTMFALVMTICWGWLHDRWLVLASVYAWGFGDAAAALIGKRFGKHKINWKYIDGRKSFEGSGAMFAVSLLSLLVILSLRGGLSPAALIAVSVVTAAVSTLSELYTPGGNDTVTCPLSAMAVLLPLLALFGGLV